MQGSGRSKPTFIAAIESKSKKSGSKIVLALDLDFRGDTSNLLSDAASILRKTADYICAVKLNFHLIAPLSLGELSGLNRIAADNDLTSIADIKLNDIANTNRVATEYLWNAGFSAVIANPFVGFRDGLDAVLIRAHSKGKGVILLAYMSHKGAEEGYGLEISNGRKIYEVFLERAMKWNADGVIVGSTRPEKISEAKKLLRGRVKIFSPGSGAQGGDPIGSLRAGADYLIFGRSIVESENPKEEVMQIFRSLTE